MQFHADLCQCDESDEEGLASLFLQNLESGRYLSAVRELCEGPVEIVRDDQCWSSRKGVETCMLSRTALTVTVSPQSSAELGVKVCDITFHLSDHEWTNLRKAVTAIFTGHADLEIDG